MSGLFPLLTVIASGILYHVAQRTSGTASPWAMLIVAYGVALGLSVLFGLSSGELARLQPGRAEWTGGVLLGLSAFGIEASFYFIYRAGWPLSSASVISSTSVTAILAILGVAVFGEHLSAARAAGLALAAGAATLIARG